MSSPVNSQVIAIAVVHREEHYLIGQRPENVALAGLWEFPGGKVEPGDSSPADAACRECLEETGIEVVIERPLTEVRHAYPHGTLELHFFLARPLDSHAEPRGSFRWVPRDQMLRLEFPPANQLVLEQIGAARY